MLLVDFASLNLFGPAQGLLVTGPSICSITSGY